MLNKVTNSDEWLAQGDGRQNISKPAVLYSFRYRTDGKILGDGLTALDGEMLNNKVDEITVHVTNILIDKGLDKIELGPPIELWLPAWADPEIYLTHHEYSIRFDDFSEKMRLILIGEGNMHKSVGRIKTRLPKSVVNSNFINSRAETLPLALNPNPRPIECNEAQLFSDWYQLPGPAVLVRLRRTNYTGADFIDPIVGVLSSDSIEIQFKTNDFGDLGDRNSNYERFQAFVERYPSAHAFLLAYNVDRCKMWSLPPDSLQALTRLRPPQFNVSWRPVLPPHNMIDICNGAAFALDDHFYLPQDVVCFAPGDNQTLANVDPDQQLCRTNISGIPFYRIGLQCSRIDALPAHLRSLAINLIDSRGRVDLAETKSDERWRRALAQLKDSS